VRRNFTVPIVMLAITWISIRPIWPAAVLSFRLPLAVRQVTAPQHIAAELFKLIGLDIHYLVAARYRSQEIGVHIIPHDRRRGTWVDEYAVCEQSKALS